MSTNDWTNRHLLDLLNIEHPIIQAPMAGASGIAMAAGVIAAGGLGSLPCAMLSLEKIEHAVKDLRQGSSGPLNLNFFCHQPPKPNHQIQQQWLDTLNPYYQEYKLQQPDEFSPPVRQPFDASTCALVETLRPEVVSFHFGLPDPALLDRVKACGSKILSTATCVEEATWLAQQGCDVIIAQGTEAGGHRGMFLTSDHATQPTTFALVPQVVDAVDIPVVAAGAIADGRGINAALALGASGVQIGTAFLFTKEATISSLHAQALQSASADDTALTNLFSGRPARGLVNRLMAEIGPMSNVAPQFPTAGTALAPLKEAAEAKGLTEFSSLWSGQAAPLGRTLANGCSAQTLTIRLVNEALAS